MYVSQKERKNTNIYDISTLNCESEGKYRNSSNIQYIVGTVWLILFVLLFIIDENRTFNFK